MRIQQQLTISVATCGCCKRLWRCLRLCLCVWVQQYLKGKFHNWFQFLFMRTHTGTAVYGFVCVCVRFVFCVSCSCVIYALATAFNGRKCRRQWKQRQKPHTKTCPCMSKKATTTNMGKIHRNSVNISVCLSFCLSLYVCGCVWKRRLKKGNFQHSSSKSVSA